MYISLYIIICTYVILSIVLLYRLTVQIGRYDAKEANKKQGISWSNPNPSNIQIEQLVDNFMNSGLSSKEVVVLIGQ